MDAVLVVHEHGHPHILLLQIGTAFFKLPGGRLRPGESDVEGLLRKLTTHLSPEAEHLKPDWQVGEVIGTYYRPNFENVMYPYCPPHIQRPKEIRKLFVVHLPEKCYLAVPKNYRLIAVPLFEIYDHIQRYGPIISSLPQMLSRFDLVLTRGGGGVGSGGMMPAEPLSLQGGGDMNTETALVLGGGGGEDEKKRKRDENEFTVDFDE